MEDGFTDFSTDFWIAFCGLARENLAVLIGYGFGLFCSQKRRSADMVQPSFGEAISFSPSVSFTFMHVYMNTEIK